ELSAGIAAGLVKVNIGTALNTAFTPVVRQRLAEDPAGTDPRKYLAPARAAMTETVARLAAVVAGSRSGQLG
ncbi:class II fructose-bisphosphate aldolase, partial [Kitasatospora nipponensis]